MKRILLTLFCIGNLLAFGQTDTIFTKKGKTIICTITQMNTKALYYKEPGVGGEIEEIEMEKVATFSQHGQKHTTEFLFLNKELPHDSVMLTHELEYMKECFRSCHREYIAGATTSLCGIGISIFSIYATASGKGNTELISIIGGAVALAGTIVMVDSHKWIGRAGIGITGNGVSVKYIFK